METAVGRDRAEHSPTTARTAQNEPSNAGIQALSVSIRRLDSGIQLTNNELLYIHTCDIYLPSDAFGEWRASPVGGLNHSESVTIRWDLFKVNQFMPGEAQLPDRVGREAPRARLECFVGSGAERRGRAAQEF